MKFLIISLFIIFFAFSVRATVGEPVFITDIFYNDKSNEIVYITDYGYWQVITAFSLENKTTRTLFDGQKEAENPSIDSKAEFEKQKAKIRNESEALRPVNLKSTGIQFSCKIQSAVNVYDDTGKPRDRTGEWIAAGLSELRLLWEVTPVAEDTLSPFAIVSCHNSYRLSYRGYSLPGRDFLFIICRTIGYCAEGGYAFDETHIIEDFMIKDDSFIETVKENELKNQAMKVDTYGAVVEKFDKAKVLRFVNDIGFDAYSIKMYETAIVYFRAAFEMQGDNLTYLRPLYNLVCSESLAGKSDDAITHLSELLKAEKSRETYLEKIQKDADFDPIRQSTGFIELISKYN